MKINIENTVKIEAALCGANGSRAGLYKLYRATAVCDMAHDAERSLAASGIPKCAWVGAVVTGYGPAPQAKAYKNSVTTTHVILQRFASGWFMTRAVKSVQYAGPGAGGIASITIPPAMADIVRQHAMKKFTVAPGEVK